ncbi:hypothetical protein HK105_208162 [Polyrhizophydium stewartii]|uniref:Dynein regulatory complex protein 9 n=1 Tax=Polyrhizophydium stewartii TaxID=2732419 RepID=A0ABR4MYM2_9FUNG|nr:hypothetical protein HK105_007158 [Polyrhizophydium stewartii]
MSATLPPLPGSMLKQASDAGLDSAPSAAVPTSSAGNLLPPAKAQAYIAIFEDALDQLAVLGDITPEVMKTDNKQLSEKITKILFEQRSLQERYQDLLAEQEQQRAQPNKTKLKEIQSAISDVSSQLQANAQSLARHLKTHPSVAQNLLKIQQERSSLQALLARTIRELRDYRFDSLVWTVEEEYKKRNTLQHTINRHVHAWCHLRNRILENDASDMLKELQRELANEKRLIQDEINDRNQVIQQLKDTIQEINALTASEQKYIKKEVKAHENSVKLQCQEKESSLHRDRELLLKKIEQERLAHDKIVDFLARQRESLEKEIQEWMTKYEEDTEAKAAELEALKQKRAQDLDKFEELVAAYESLEKTVDEDKQIRAKEAEEARLLAAQDAAATKIQRWYRKRKQMRAAQNAAKAPAKQGKGKGGKGGKGAKGGKGKKK